MPTPGVTRFLLNHFGCRRLNLNFLESASAVQTFIDTENWECRRPKLTLVRNPEAGLLSTVPRAFDRR